MTPGTRFRQAIADEVPLQLPGVVNAYSALLARDAGFSALYLSGAAVANASYGIPDLGLTSRDNVLEEVRRITGATNLPLLVDADTGWGSALAVSRTVSELERAGAAGCHIEDQVAAKCCGDRPNKQLISTSEMCDRIKAALDGRKESSFNIVARTDAVAPEGLEAAVERCGAYAEAGANMIFSEGLASLDEYQSFTSAVEIPVLANITEFGNAPLFKVDELQKVGVAVVLYPLSGFRAMNKAALEVFKDIRVHGTQKGSIDRMETREELYNHLGYHGYVKKFDELFGGEAAKEEG